MADDALPKQTHPGNPAGAKPEAKGGVAGETQASVAAKPVAGRKRPGGTRKVAPAQAGDVRKELLGREEPAASRIWMRQVLRQIPSWLVSLVFHMVGLLILALWMLPEARPQDPRQLIVAPGENDEFDELEELQDEPLQSIDISTELMAVETEVVAEEVNISPADDMEGAAVQVELSEFGLEHAPRSDLLAAVGTYSGTGLSGRGKGRGALWRKTGGTEASERAVTLALKWLAEHQMADGGWSFNHTLCPRCNGACRNPGTVTVARRGATAMALLPFLGAGQTHKSGKYRSTVKNGLYFLVRNIRTSPQGGSLHEPGGNMYSHGLGAIALCEAYAMTHDKGLQDPAQAAINFICSAQDRVGGGWRYRPGERGDTSVVGWQIMALKSGDMAYLLVPPQTVQMARRYLDGVQADGGAAYGYVYSPDEEPPQRDQSATTAIGLLCRMYLGWKKDNPALIRGVKWLGDEGPSPTNMYYNYYATQVMRHWEGQEWEKWNSVMRDQLVNSQAAAGHERGSWYFSGGHGEVGGRLYNTAMATMILEVYYRHLPIYRKQSTEEDFPE